VSSSRVTRTAHGIVSCRVPRGRTAAARQRAVDEARFLAPARFGTASVDPITARRIPLARAGELM
jgi:hypothetical protein